MGRIKIMPWEVEWVISWLQSYLLILRFIGVKYIHHSYPNNNLTCFVRFETNCGRRKMKTWNDRNQVARKNKGGLVVHGGTEMIRVRSCHAGRKWEWYSGQNQRYSYETVWAINTDQKLPWHCRRMSRITTNLLPTTVDSAATWQMASHCRCMTDGHMTIRLNSLVSNHVERWTATRFRKSRSPCMW